MNIVRLVFIIIILLSNMNSVAQYHKVSAYRVKDCERIFLAYSEQLACIKKIIINEEAIQSFSRQGKKFFVFIAYGVGKTNEYYSFETNQDLEDILLLDPSRIQIYCVKGNDNVSVRTETYCFDCECIIL